jgi:hypothetical protein
MNKFSFFNDKELNKNAVHEYMKTNKIDVHLNDGIVEKGSASFFSKFNNYMYMKKIHLNLSRREYYMFVESILNRSCEFPGAFNDFERTNLENFFITNMRLSPETAEDRFVAESAIQFMTARISTYKAMNPSN